MIYIDCTSTYSIKMLTGIQRVVYNIVEKALLDQNLSNSVQPVVLSSRGFLPIKHLEKHQYSAKDVSKLNTKKRKSFYDWIILLQIRKFPIIYNIIKNIYFIIRHKKIANIIKEPSVVFTKDDTLLFLDACWGMPIWKEVTRAKRQGARVVFVVYDLIPIRFPQFCDEPHTKALRKFIVNSFDMADMYLGISKTVIEDIKSFAHEIGHERAQTIQYDYFYLGADFSHTIYEGMVRDEMKDFFQGNAPVFLTVSTLEPRKNHVTILKAFDVLWARGIDVKLCFIGKVGWKIDVLLETIKSHKMLNTKFLVFYDANDFELSYAYQHAHTLVFASFAEGFGLPIIESMGYGLPVLASDLPIHKEIGRDTIDYFDLNDFDAFINKIENIARKPKKHTKITWIGWQESTHSLFSKITK